MTDYEKSLENCKTIPKFYLGEEVETPIGYGIIVNLILQHNGLFIDSGYPIVVVWFSVADSKDGFVNRSFNISEITKRQDLIRDEKLNILLK